MAVQHAHITQRSLRAAKPRRKQASEICAHASTLACELSRAFLLDSDVLKVGRCVQIFAGSGSCLPKNLCGFVLQL